MSGPTNVSLPGGTRRSTRELPRTLIAGGAITLFWLLVAALAPVLAPYDPLALDLTATLQAPGPSHWLGTDHFGRDILSRAIYAARIDLFMGIGGVLAPFVIGNLIGVVAGYYGRYADIVLMRILDVALAFPYFVLVLAIVAMLGPGLTSYFISLAVVGWVSYARLIRAQVLVLKEQDFLLAEQTIGLGSLRIMLRHVLPNAIAPSTVYVMTDIVLVILLGAALSFIGVGIQPPTPEWGAMIAEGQQYLRSAWWICVFPGLAIAFVALGFSLIADGLSDLLRVPM